MGIERATITHYTHQTMAKRTKSARKAAKLKPSAPRQRTPARKGYKVWTEPEKVALTAGVAKYGPGQWKKILDDPAFGPKLTNRSNVDLKDKWRGASPTPTKKTKTPVAVSKATKPSSAKKLAFTKSPPIGVRRSPSKTRPSYTKTKPAPPPRRPSSARKAAKPVPAKKPSAPAPAKKSAPAKASSGGCVIM